MSLNVLTNNEVGISCVWTH